MGCCSGLCKVLLMIWTVISLLFALALIAFMAYRVTDLSEAIASPNEIYDLLAELVGTGWYATINIVDLNTYTWYAALGLGALMFISCIIHIISTCKASRCLLGLSTLLMVLTLAADVAGLVFRFEAVGSISVNMNISLNETIINQYGNADFDDITDSWNLLGDARDCCGISSGDDFKHAIHWKGEIKADVPPCGADINLGCGEFVHDKYVISEDIWLTTVIAVKIMLLFITLLHTICVCKMGFGKTGGQDGGTDSYTLVERR